MQTSNVLSVTCFFGLLSVTGAWADPASAPAGSAVEPTVVTTAKKGVTIAVPGMTPVLVDYPSIEGEKIIDIQADGKTATVTYDVGTKVSVKIGEHNTIGYHYADLPKEVKKVEFELPLDPTFAQGGVFRVDDANVTPFPVTTPPDPKLYHKNALRLSVHDAQQRNLSIYLPGHSYLQIEDWRDKTPSVFATRIFSPVMSPDMSMHIGGPPPTRAPANQPPITIPYLSKAPTIDGKTDAWKGIPWIALDATREVGGQAHSTLHASLWNVPTSLEGQKADVSARFRVGWDGKNLYLLVDVTDPTPLHNPNLPDRLWSGDAIELFIGSEMLDLTGDLVPSDRQVMLGADATAGSLTYVRGVKDQPQFPSIAVARPGGYIVEAAIPLSVLNLSPTAGTKLLFDLGIDDSVDGKTRHAQLMWNGTDQNSSVRTNWGHAVLGK